MKVGMIFSTIVTLALGLFLYRYHFTEAVIFAEKHGPVVCASMIGLGLLATWLVLAALVGHTCEGLFRAVTKRARHYLLGETDRRS